MIPDYNSLPQSSLEYPNSMNFLCRVALWNKLGFSFKNSANTAFVEAEGSFFIILVSVMESLSVHFTCLILFHVFSVLAVSQYFCKIFLRVLQGLLVHLDISDKYFPLAISDKYFPLAISDKNFLLAIYDTFFPRLLSSTSRSFMAGGVHLLILNRKRVVQIVYDYSIKE